ncbi:hypothetical protein LPJ72_002670 [Coemansia sp. Benny D160-2]|nr:hypothetical protein LPJ72_002670 [Coemansia sp. Benny D160-2]
MVLLSNSVSLLVIALAASFQLGNAVPRAQQGIISIVPKQQEQSQDEGGGDAATAAAGGGGGEGGAFPKEGDSCNEQTDRTTCADENSLLFCRQSEWVTFSNCTLGTVCKDGFCVYPDGTTASNQEEPSSPAADASASDSASDSAADQQDSVSTNDSAESGDSMQQPSSSVADQTDAAAVGSSSQPADVAATDSAAASAASSAPADQPQESAGGASSDASAGSSAAEESSSSSSAEGGDSSGGGSTSGDTYGITCEKFNKAVSEASSAIGQNYPTPSSAQCNAFLKGMKPEGDISSAEEAAMFLANILWESDGLRAKEEYSCVDNPDQCAQTYKTAEDTAGKTYWGRGYIQLTWQYNYKAASEGLYGDDRLVSDPEMVSTDEDTAWGVSFWYWKANVHSDAKVQAGQFGASINDINGALECKGAAQDKAKKRYEMYKPILAIFAPDVQPIESGCYN